MSSPNPAKIQSNFKLEGTNLELSRHSHPTPNISPKKQAQFKVPLIPEKNSLQPKSDSNKSSRGIFVLFLLSNLLINYDGGVIPASLVQIETELKISYTQEAALGSVVYVGLSAASLFVSSTFKRFQAKNILGFMMLIKAICCGLFSYFSNLMLLYICRILMGVTQAFPVIYAPVWVNEFSPKEKSTTWMGLLHGFVPIGIMLGFIIAGFIINFFPTMLSWRFAFQIQAVCELPLAILFFLQDNKKIDVLHQEKEQATIDRKAEANLTSAERNIRIDAINYDTFKHTWEQVKKVLGNKTLILTCLSLCSLFYVVTGVQYWSSMYMIKILKMSPENAMMSFGIIAISAPLAGVFVGGLTSDSLGGYKGDNLLTAVKLCTAYSIVAFLVSMPLSFTTKLWFFIPLLWSMLLFGACIIPIATGITVDCVPREYQAANSSFSQLVYNIFGYFLAPVLSAMIMDQFHDQDEGLLWGFRSVLWFSVFGVLFMMLHWGIISSNESYKEMPEESMSRAEIDFEVARRRAVSYL